MARPRKGESPPGFYMPCAVCGELQYRAPNRIGIKKTYCKQHKYGDAFFFHCIVCGEKVYTQPAQIKYRNRRHCSKKCAFVTKHKATLERRKTYTKHQLDRLARYSRQAKEWRESVFTRDNYTCQECGVRGSYLEADHIKPFAYFPELRYELSNGRTLCRPCHDKTKVSYKKMRELYSS